MTRCTLLVAATLLCAAPALAQISESEASKNLKSGLTVRMKADLATLKAEQKAFLSALKEFNGTVTGGGYLFSLLQDLFFDYQEVIWFTGAMERNTLTPEDQSDLEAYLNGGGRLLLSGSMIGYDIGSTPFYRNYLHARYVSFLTLLHHLNGVPSNPIVGEMSITLASGGPNAQGFAGETDPISPAVSLFDYDRSTEEGPGIISSSGSGALAAETADYKVVYTSFGLEGIEPLEDRVQVLADVLSWFKEPGVDKGDVDGNGTTDIIDAVMAVNIVLGLYQPDEDEIARADMNYDGEIDILDVINIVNAVLGRQVKSTGENLEVK